MSDVERLRQVVIVGGGTAGWMCAAAMSRFLNNGVTQVTLVESEEIGTVGVGEATIPPITDFHGLLGIDEAQMLRATGGTFKLGIVFRDWGAIGDRYIHPFGQYGQPIIGVAFHQVWAKLHALGRAGPLDDYSVSATAAHAGRFGRDAGEPRPFSRPTWAYHFDAALYAAFLRRFAERRVTRIEGRVASVERDGTGDVLAVVLADGRRVAGDLFVDCTGFRSLLLGGAMGVAFESWRRWLPCDRAVAVGSAPDPSPPPYTTATARSAGWQWRIPLRHRTGNGLVYAADHLAPAAAEAALLAALGGPAVAEVRHLSFEAGRRERFWAGNVVALGLAAGFLEPLESTAIHLVQTGISQLLALLPGRRPAAIERDTYNHLMARTYERVRDFVILHYHASTRTDSPFWRAVHEAEPPEALAARVALWREKGRLFRHDEELFDVGSWLSVLRGQGVEARGYDPIVDALDVDRVAAAADHIGANIRRAVAAMPVQGEFLDRLHGAPAPASASWRPAIDFAV